MAELGKAEFEYLVPGWLWNKSPASVLRAARQMAKRKRMSADGDPIVHVVLVWPQETVQRQTTRRAVA